MCNIVYKLEPRPRIMSEGHFVQILFLNRSYQKRVLLPNVQYYIQELPTVIIPLDEETIWQICDYLQLSSYGCFTLIFSWNYFPYCWRIKYREITQLSLIAYTKPYQECVPNRDIKMKWIDIKIKSKGVC